MTRVTPAVLLIVAALALVVRVAAVAAPLGIDQGLWASAVHGMSQGQLLYTDVWEQRPPGIYFTYLAAFSLFGWTTAAVAWLDITAATLTTALLWWLGVRLDSRLTGATAAALYAAGTLPAGLYGYGGLLERSVCETFIVVCVAAAALCGTRLRERDDVLAAAGLGLFCGIAVIFKPNAGLYFPAIVAWVLCYRVPRGGAAVRVMAPAALAATLPAIAIVVWLWQNGSIADARTAVIDFNRWYVAAGFDVVRYAAAFTDVMGLRVKTDVVWTAGLLAALAAVVHLVRTRTLPAVAGLGVLWGAATVLVIVSNGARLFNTYFMQALAPLCLLSAWMLASRTLPGTTVVRLFRGVAMAAMVWVLVTGGYVRRAYTWTAGDVAALTGRTDRVTHLQRYGGYANERGYSARANEEVAAYVAAHSQPDERVFLFGVNGADLYFLADRLSAHRFLRVNFFYPDDFPDPEFTLTAVTRDLTARRPRYVVFENLHANSAIGRAVSGVATDPRVQALLASYELDTVIEDFTLYRRRD